MGKYAIAKKHDERFGYEGTYTILKWQRPWWQFGMGKPRWLFAETRLHLLPRLFAPVTRSYTGTLSALIGQQCYRPVGAEDCPNWPWLRGGWKVVEVWQSTGRTLWGS